MVKTGLLLGGSRTDKGQLATHLLVRSSCCTTFATLKFFAVENKVMSVFTKTLSIFETTTIREAARCRAVLATPLIHSTNKVMSPVISWYSPHLRSCSFRCCIHDSHITWTCVWEFSMHLSFIVYSFTTFLTNKKSITKNESMTAITKTFGRPETTTIGSTSTAGAVPTSPTVTDLNHIM